MGLSIWVILIPSPGSSDEKNIRCGVSNPIGVIVLTALLTTPCSGSDSNKKLPVFSQNTNITILNREKIFNLAGQWRFRADPKNVGETEKWFQSGVHDRLSIVPSTWQVVFEDLREYVGSGWYERKFFISSKFRGRRIAAVFCTANYYTKVWVNGHLAGEHEGRHIPFDVDLTSRVNFDEPNTRDCLHRVAFSPGWVSLFNQRLFLMFSAFPGKIMKGK